MLLFCNAYKMKTNIYPWQLFWDQNKYKYRIYYKGLLSSDQQIRGLKKEISKIKDFGSKTAESILFTTLLGIPHSKLGKLVGRETLIT